MDSPETRGRQAGVAEAIKERINGSAPCCSVEAGVHTRSAEKCPVIVEAESRLSVLQTVAIQF